MEKVIALYDVRGIQKYIYRTQKVKDAMGASALVENIIERALIEATKGYEVELEWYNKDGILPFKEKDIAVQVLFIGGGNAYVLFQNVEICKEINQSMSRYILEETYSLQLAVAYVPKTENYSEDNKRLHQEMERKKANIKSAKPIGAFPIMQTEFKTGYPLTNEGEQNNTRISYETYKKGMYKRRTITEEEEKIFDNLIYKKGVDSNLAVVHIDGNNMGLRIRKLIECKKDKEEGKISYVTAVNEMRNISYHIRTSYLKAFDEMEKKFKSKEELVLKEASELKGKFELQQNNKKLIRKIVVAGDDITYVCNARIALDTVEDFVKRIVKYTMNGEKTEEAYHQYGFSICAGIAYMKSHFPFAIAYDVAEACCDNAKERAKSEENRDGERIGNYMDFQICSSIQCRNLEEMRRKNYITPTGETLFIRPYYIPTDCDGGLAKSRDISYHYENFKEYVKYFLEERNIPRSYAKEIQNTYPLGSHEIKLLERFLESRGWQMPNGEMKMFEKNTALWYDALEMMDYCIDWKETNKKEEVKE